MGTRLWLALALTSACGRVGFDALATPAGGDARAGDAAGDAPGGGDGTGSDSAVTSGVALAQMGVVVAATTNLMLSLPAPSTPGTLLVAAIATNGTSGVGLPSGWTMATTVGINGSCSTIIAYYENNPGGITTATFTQIAGTPGAGELTEWTGAMTTGSLDATGTATGNSPGTAQSVATAMAPAAGELAVAAFCEDVNSPLYTAGSGWTQLGTYSNVSSSPSFEHDYLRGTPAAIVTDSVTSSVAGKYAAVIATFR